MSDRTLGLGQDLHRYVIAEGVRESGVARRLREDTARMPMARMQISPEQGALLQMLVRHAPTLDDRHDGAFARALIELLPTALGGPRDLGVEARRQDHLRREAVEQLIDREIANRQLTGAAIAEGVGVSRATLYRLYERNGGIAGHVRRRRIDGVRGYEQQRFDFPIPLARAGARLVR